MALSGDVAGRQLAYRSRQNVGSYFRLVVVCDRCQALSIRRSVRIKSRRDLDEAVALDERFGSAEHCPEPAEDAQRSAPSIRAALDLAAL